MGYVEDMFGITDSKPYEVQKTTTYGIPQLTYEEVIDEPRTQIEIRKEIEAKQPTTNTKYSSLMFLVAIVAIIILMCGTISEGFNNVRSSF